MRFDKKLAVLSLFASMTFVAISGATVGTLAWFAYTKNVTMSFTGTSVSTSLLLRVGIVDDTHYLSDEKVEEYGLVRESNDTHSIVWSNSANGFSDEAIIEYLTHSPYAVNKLYPVSSHSRSLNSTAEFKLYHAPERGYEFSNLEASTDEYVQLPLAFKVLGNSNQKLNNQQIWMTDATVKASGENIDKAVRVFVDTATKDFIMNPSDHSLNGGATKVGGLLDLDDNGTYDFDDVTHKELVYGEYSGTLAHSPAIYGISYDFAELDNVNETPYTSNGRSTFYAKHDHDSYCALLDSFEPKVAEYYSFGQVKPSVNSEGDYYEGATGIKIATTNSSDLVGYATFTIYLEGWDFAVIDRAKGTSFSLGLEFTINRL